MEMNELLKRLFVNKCTCNDSNAWGTKKEVNQLLGVNLRTDSNVHLMVEDFEKRIKSRSNNLRQIPVNCEERINVLSEFYKWIPVKPEKLQKFTKDSEISAAFRFKANELFVKKQTMNLAWHLYNVAIMFAEPTGAELGLAFANRSALLLENQDPWGALKDMDLAIQHNYPEGLMPKLERRREKSLKMLKEFERSNSAQDIQSDVAKIQKYRDELLKLKNPNPLIPCAENFVKIGHADDVGRQLVVTKDIPAATVVLIEQPYLSVNMGLLEFQARHCDHCYKFIKNGIPCKQCVFVMYCTDECRTNASSGHHKYECACLSSLYFASVEVYSILAFRIICKISPEELCRLFTTRDPDYFECKKPFGTARDCKYESDSYLPIHHLVNYSSTLSEKTRQQNGLTCLQLVSILEARTNFFKVCEERKDFREFVAGTLLRLMETTPCNGLVMEEVRPLQMRSLAQFCRLKETKGSMEQALETDTFFDRTSIGIYSVGNLMNHSCDYNTLRVFDSHGTMVVVTSRTLKKGEPLTTSYGVVYDGTDTLAERRDFLMRKGFKCECIACKNDWPIAGDLMTKLFAHEFTCPTCSKKFKEVEKSSGRFLKCCLLGSRPTCGLCGKSYKRQKLEDTYQSVMLKYVDALDAIEENRTVEVVEAYMELSAYFQFNIRPPHYILGMTRQLFHQAMALIVYSGD